MISSSKIIVTPRCEETKKPLPEPDDKHTEKATLRETVILAEGAQ